MSQPARRRATYQDVLDAPEHVTAQVLDGELYLHPRPKRRHTRTASGLGAFLFNTFDLGIGGPGGWTILYEPELHLGDDILVPDIAGWRDGRLIDDPDQDEPFIAVVPDWVAEILSPGTARIDRVRKMPIYRRERVAHVWLVDPVEHTVDAFRLAGADYVLVGTFGGEEPLALEPFEAAAVGPLHLWGRGARLP